MKTYRYCYKSKNVGYNVWTTKTKHVKKAGYTGPHRSGGFADALAKSLIALLKV